MKKLVKGSSKIQIDDPFKYPRKSLKKLLKMLDSDDVADDIASFLGRSDSSELVKYICEMHDVDYIK